MVLRTNLAAGEQDRGSNRSCSTDERALFYSFIH